MKKPLLLGCMVACALINPSFSQELVTNVSGSAYAMASSGKQDNENSSLEEVLTTLQSRYKISILYKSDLVKDKMVRNPSYGGSVQEALINVLKPLGLKFKNPKSSLFIIVKENESKDLKISEIDSKTISTEGTTAAANQNNDLQMLASLKMSVEKVADVPVKGKVTSETGEALPGVNVVVKGTTLGTTTDGTGSYSLNVPDGNAVLVFSFIGFTTEEVAVGSRSVVDVKLVADVESLQEVVVVGYGTQKKTSVTGAISTVAAKDIAVQPVASIGQALQGRVAGVTVVNSGAPGAAPIVRIRGIGTVNNADPLYVIDGFPTGDLTSFNTKDIESVEVLKDASAVAIYGSRAGNGVILITTKKGASGKLKVNIDSYYGVEKAWKQLDLLNTDQYISYATDLMTNSDIYKNETNGTDPDVVVGSGIPTRIKSGLDAPINSTTSQTFRQTNTDWQGEMFRTAPIQQHKVDISGGNDKSKIFASFGFFDQTGIMKGTGYTRGDARLNSDHKISKRITFGQNFYVAYNENKIEQNAGGRTQIQHMIRSAPYFPVLSPDNYGGYFGAQGVDGSDPENPVRIAAMDKQNQQRLKLLGNAYVDVKLFDFLSYRFQGGVDYVDYTQRTHLPAYNTGPGGYSSRTQAGVNQNHQNFVSTILTNQLTFNKSFGQHTINATAVIEKQNFTFSQITGNGNNTQSNDILEPVALANQSFNGSRSESVLISYLGRINYDYANKYLIGASFRRDGSSRFAKDNRWGNYPSLSLGWRISKEGFLKESNLISDLKIRASYGLAGNNIMPNGNDYAYQSTISGNSIYEFDKSSAVGSAGYTTRALANPKLKWETTTMQNIGLDLGLWNNRLTMTLEYFKNNTRDMILAVPIPVSYGYDGAPVANVGEVQNKGFEAQLGYNKSQGDFTYNVSGNISVVRNKVLDLGDEGTTISAGDWYGDNITRTEVGKPIGYFYGYQTDGLFQSQSEIDSYLTKDGKKMQPNARPGDIRFKDSNNDGQLNADDKKQIGHFLPDFSYGMNFNAGWKGFDASLFLQGVSGNEIYSVVKYDLEGMTRLFNSGAAVANRWTPTNTNTNVPRAVSGDYNGNARASDRFIENGSYFRVKNFTLGYSVPTEVLSSLANNTLTRLRIYMTAQNLLTITKYKSGYDPEIGNRNSGQLTQGIDYGQYPQARSIVFGVQIGF